MKSFGERLREIREKQGITSNELCSLLNVASGTVSRWEAGKREPGIETINALASALNTSVAYLMGETDDPRPILRLDGTMKLDGGSVIGKDPERQSLYKKLPGGLIGVGPDIILVPRVSEQYSPHCGGAGHATYLDDAAAAEGYEPIVSRLLGDIDAAAPPRAYKVDGSSMVDYGVPPDSWVVVNPAQWVTAGAVCLVEIGGNPVIKKVYPKGDGYELHASNGQMIKADQGDIESEYIRIIGKVVGVQGTVDHRP